MASTWAAEAAAPTRRPLALQHVIDLLALLALAVLAPLLVQAPLPLLRIPLGLVLVLFAPGYALQAALFARKSDLDQPARLGASIGLSIVALPLLAIMLDLSPWGIRQVAIALSLCGWIAFFCVIALIRRWWIGVVDVVAPGAELERDGRWQQVFAVLAVGGLLIVMMGGAMAVTGAQTDQLTEFYVTGSAGLAESYPHEARVGEPVAVQLGITNGEGRAMRYRVEVRSGDQTIATVPAIEVATDATYQQQLEYALSQPGQDQAVDILLFRADDQTPYRRLRLWINVRE